MNITESDRDPPSDRKLSVWRRLLDRLLGSSPASGPQERDDDAAITRDPDAPDAWAEKARCRLLRNDHSVAAECAIAALARGLDDPGYGRLLIEAAAKAGDAELLALATGRQLRLFPGEREDPDVRRLVPEALLASSSDIPPGDLDAFEWALRTIRDRRPRRYVQVLQCLLAQKPRSIVEIGVFNGANAADMIRAGGRTPERSRSLRYIGFDLFEEMTPDVHEKEFSKFPLPRVEIDAALSVLNDNHVLIGGYTQDTMAAFRAAWDAEREPVDFVFLDGGHSEETIESDWSNIAPLLSERSVVILDDYYLDKAEALDGLGCNALIERLARDPRYLVEMLPIRDSFDKEFGLLTIALVKVRLKPSAS